MCPNPSVGRGGLGARRPGGGQQTIPPATAKFLQIFVGRNDPAIGYIGSH